MLRFKPDDWLEGLMRPFLLMDPKGWIYVESIAPDVRFAALFVLMVVALFGRRARAALTSAQGLTALGLLTMMWVWTFIIGNGRYFIWGLLLVGPLLVLACRLLPASRGVRVLVLLCVLGAQAVVLLFSDMAGVWAQARVKTDPLPIEASPLREEPAVFLTTSLVSYSALVPRFHAQSRWANVEGQRSILPGDLEYPRLQALLASDLPKYVVQPVMGAGLTEAEAALQVGGAAARVLAPLGLAVRDGPCHTLRSPLVTMGVFNNSSDARQFRALWFCRLHSDSATQYPVQRTDAADAELSRALDAVEQRCPRFFPPGSARDLSQRGLLLRRYVYSDVSLYATKDRNIYFRHFRAVEPTRLGTAEAVAAGRFTMDCRKLPGRYRPPWDRD
jgi:hypothetical protein